MKLPRRNFLHLASGAAALPAVSRITWAQNYPRRPVCIIVGFAPGGSTDIVSANRTPLCVCAWGSKNTSACRTVRSLAFFVSARSRR